MEVKQREFGPGFHEELRLLCNIVSTAYDATVWSAVLGQLQKDPLAIKMAHVLMAICGHIRALAERRIFWVRYLNAQDLATREAGHRVFKRQR